MLTGERYLRVKCYSLPLTEMGTPTKTSIHKAITFRQSYIHLLEVSDGSQQEHGHQYDAHIYMIVDSSIVVVKDLKERRI